MPYEIKLLLICPIFRSHFFSKCEFSIRGLHTDTLSFVAFFATSTNASMQYFYRIICELQMVFGLRETSKTPIRKLTQKRDVAQIRRFSHAIHVIFDWTVSTRSSLSVWLSVAPHRYYSIKSEQFRKMNPFALPVLISAATSFPFIKREQLFVCLFFSIFRYSGGIKFSDLTTDEGKWKIIFAISIDTTI